MALGKDTQVRLSKLVTSYVNNQFIHNNQEDFYAYSCAAGECH